jgi:hypothetical protein
MRATRAGSRTAAARAGRAGTGIAVVAPAGLEAHVSALLPRGVLVGAAALGVVAQTAGRDLPPGALLPVLLALVAAWRPRLPAALLAVAGLGVLAVLGGPGVDARDGLTVLAVHLVHVSAALVAVLPAGTRVELAALRPTWRRFLLVQGLSQLTVLVAATTSLTR